MVQSKLAEAQFWQIEHLFAPGGFDGAEWILEGRRGNRYQVMRQWSPKSGPLKSLGLLLLKMSGLDVPSKEVY